MAHFDPSQLTVPELVHTYISTIGEFRRRGLVRTRGSLAGELGERLALDAFGGTLETAGKKSIDLVDGDGRQVQVKSRALEPGVNRIFAFSTFDFDIVVFIMFDATTYEISWAREMTADDAKALARFRVPTGDYAIATSKVKRAGIDITGQLRAAYLMLT